MVNRARYPEAFHERAVRMAPLSPWPAPGVKAIGR